MSYREMAQVEYESGNIKMAEVYEFLAKVENLKEKASF